MYDSSFFFFGARLVTFRDLSVVEVFEFQQNGRHVLIKETAGGNREKHMGNSEKNK